MHSAAVLLGFAFFSVSTSSQTFPDNNPKLGRYQNDVNFFPSKEPWYLVYENFDYDPIFNDNGTCVRMTGKSREDGNTMFATAEFWPSPPMELDVALTSSPGYDVDNVIVITNPKEPSETFNLTIAYIEPETCVIVRHSYVDEGKGCSYWVPESQLGKTIRCCEFIFDLLCGTPQKYTIYEDGGCPE
uniref:Putative lipocal-1 1 n=1 Tax=Amblyomma triste TaxID=251400 RepID=A0A023GAC1_AMBTT